MTYILFEEQEKDNLSENKIFSDIEIPLIKVIKDIELT